MHQRKGINHRLNIILIPQTNHRMKMREDEAVCKKQIVSKNKNRSVKIFLYSQIALIQMENDHNPMAAQTTLKLNLEQHRFELYTGQVFIVRYQIT